MAEKTPSEGEKQSAFVTLCIIVIFCLAGIGLTMMNKVLMDPASAVTYPYPFTLLCLQNAVTVVLLCWAHSAGLGVVNQFTIAKAVSWLPMILLFVFMLTTSLVAFKNVTVATVVVFRNLSALFVAMCDVMILHQPVSLRSWLSIIIMIVGSVVYYYVDGNYHFEGYIWLGLNVLGTACFQVAVKISMKRVAQVGDKEGLTNWGMTYYNNILSLPFLALGATGAFGLGAGTAFELPNELAVVDGKADAYTALMNAAPKTQFCVALSTVLGFSLSLSASTLNKRITATSQMVLNNINKVVNIIVAEVWFPSKHPLVVDLNKNGALDLPELVVPSTIGVTTVFAGGFMYAWDKSQGSKPKIEEKKA
jgi:drug/metabolite transporter (DMT)-like permease